jgi:hypothetical protein
MEKEVSYLFISKFGRTGRIGIQALDRLELALDIS